MATEPRLKRSECACEKCKSACRRRPGWFKEGEAERAAELLGIPWDEFRRDWVIRDYFEPDGVRSDERVYVLRPRKVGQDVGRDKASWSSSFHDARCVFLDEDDRCRIHAAKPWECAVARLCRPRPGSTDGSVVHWMTARTYVGKEPEPRAGGEADGQADAAPASPLGFMLDILGSLGVEEGGEGEEDASK